MAKSRRIPAYVNHKPTGQARVRIDGKDHYLGKYGSPESHEKYDELVAELVVNSQPSSCRTLNAVLAAWWEECKRRYSNGKGKLGGAGNWRPILRLLREKHGDERADGLGPKKLRNLLEAAAEEQDWSLSYTKMQLARVRRIYRWAVAEELVDVSSWQRLDTIELRHGRRTSSSPPVSDELIEQTLSHLKPMLVDMIRLQRLTGMRPGELVTMRSQDVDRSGEVWVYTPSRHKTQHRGKDRFIYIGPKAQSIVAPYLLKASETGFLFPTSRSGHYTTGTYQQAIYRACKQNGLKQWSPNQLRKAAATDVRKHLDVESAASLLGHSSSVVTQQHYAAADQQRAIEAAKLLG